MKTIMKHTEGPWIIEEGNFVYALNKNHINKFSCSIQTGFAEDGQRTATKEIEANARLIAAAPEMLEIIKEFLVDTECYCSENPTGICPVHKAEALLAKIEDGK